jgi:hypothetical protein
VAEPFYSLQGAAADEDGETPEELLLLGIEQVVAPRKCVVECLLACWGILCPARQDSESLAQPCQQRLWRQEFTAGRGQFNRQGQAV